MDNEVVQPVPDDLAMAALSDARRMSAGRFTRRDRGAARRNRAANLAGRDTGKDSDAVRRRGGYSAPGPDPARDPQRVGSVLKGYLADQDWNGPLSQARVFAEWAGLVGDDIAAHCAPQTLTDGELRIQAESTAWATQLRLLSSALLARLVTELGKDVVTKLVITGPTAPSWKRGSRSVRGARGPRDTYG